VSSLAPFVCATHLNQYASKSDIDSLIKKAEATYCPSVCVFPRWLPFLNDVGPRLATVISYPHGSDLAAAKVAAAWIAVEEGAEELEVVLDISALRNGDFQQALIDLNSVIDAVENTPIKAVIETGALTQDQILSAAQIAIDSGADVIKTSTGLGPRPVSVEDIIAIKQVTPQDVQIEAAGQITNDKQARELLKAGADRLSIAFAELDNIVTVFAATEPQLVPQAEIVETHELPPAPVQPAQQQPAPAQQPPAQAQPPAPAQQPPAQAQPPAPAQQPPAQAQPAQQPPARTDDEDEEDEDDPYQGPLLQG
jgi:deoxyribose-phosphate aldolase